MYTIVNGVKAKVDVAFDPYWHINHYYLMRWCDQHPDKTYVPYLARELEAQLPDTAQAQELGQIWVKSDDKRNKAFIKWVCEYCRDQLTAEFEQEACV